MIETLGRLKRVAPDYDAWRAYNFTENDPLVKYFNDVRDSILHGSGAPTTSASIVIDSYSGPPAGMVNGPPPPGATGMFVGDAVGGSGWVIELPDGEEEKYYTGMSAAVKGSVSVHLMAVPNEFLGEKFTDSSVAGVAGRYVEWLGALVASAQRRLT